MAERKSKVIRFAKLVTRASERASAERESRDPIAYPFDHGRASEQEMEREGDG